jgi:hypothetical protein
MGCNSNCNRSSRQEIIHLWEIKITGENDNLISICKLTNARFYQKEKRIETMEGDIYIVQKQLDQDLPFVLYSK